MGFGARWLCVLASLPVALGTITVVCVGDSNTVGKRAVSGNDYPAVLGRLLGEGYKVYNLGVSGSTVTEDTDKPYTDEDEYDDAKDLVEDATTAVVLSVFGTNDAKAEQWDDVKGDFVDEYKDFVEKWQERGATVGIGIPVPYLGNECCGDQYVDMWESIEDCPINNDIPDMIREVAADLGIVVFDLQAAFVDEFGAEDVDDFEKFEKYYADRVRRGSTRVIECPSTRVRTRPGERIDLSRTLRETTARRNRSRILWKPTEGGSLAKLDLSRFIAAQASTRSTRASSSSPRRPTPPSCPWASATHRPTRRPTSRPTASSRRDSSGRRPSRRRRRRTRRPTPCPCRRS